MTGIISSSKAHPARVAHRPNRIDLRVHQIELGMQNEGLYNTHGLLNESLEKYLYNCTGWYMTV